MHERPLHKEKKMKGWGKGSLLQKPIASADYRHAAEARLDAVVQSICGLLMEWEHHSGAAEEQVRFKRKGQ